MLGLEAGTAAYSGKLAAARDFSRQESAARPRRAGEKEMAADCEAAAALWEALYGNASHAKQHVTSRLSPQSNGRDCSVCRRAWRSPWSATQRVPRASRTIWTNAFPKTPSSASITCRRFVPSLLSVPRQRGESRRDFSPSLRPTNSASPATTRCDQPLPSIRSRRSSSRFSSGNRGGRRVSENRGLARRCGQRAHRRACAFGAGACSRAGGRRCKISRRLQRFLRPLERRRSRPAHLAAGKSPNTPSCSSSAPALNPTT